MSNSPPKHRSLNFLQQKTLALSVNTDVGVPNVGKYHLSRQSNRAWEEIFLTGKKETNRKNIPIFPRFKRVRGPTKSINNLPIGLEHGFVACSQTLASCAGFALWYAFLPAWGLADLEPINTARTNPYLVPEIGTLGILQLMLSKRRID